MRTSILRRASAVVAASATLGVVACGSSGPTGFIGGSFALADGGAAGDGASRAASGASGTSSGASAAASGGSDAGKLVVTDAGGSTGPSVPAVVYGQSATTLYAVDPNTHAVTTVADFSGCGDEVIDIALDKDSNMYATSDTGVYTVDRTTAKCTLIASGGAYPNSLSFVPAGTLDPTAEALVGYTGSVYVQIDTTTGKMTPVGTLGGDYESSGDIVSVIGGGTYLTVTGGTDCDDSDCLVEVSPTTGKLLVNYGPLGHTSVYGLAFWAGTVYGFDAAGQLFEVTLAGGILTVGTIPIPSAPAGLSFYGAGSTTAAPPVAAAQ